MVTRPTCRCVGHQRFSARVVRCADVSSTALGARESPQLGDHRLSMGWRIAPVWLDAQVRRLQSSDVSQNRSWSAA